MIFNITHHTLYEYRKSVFLEPHILRFRPTCDVTQRLISFSLKIAPLPAGQADYVDLDGNCVTQVWFEKLTPTFRIEASSQVETLRKNPFDFLIDKSQIASLGYHSELFPFFDKTRKSSGISQSVENLSQKIAKGSNGDVLTFLSSLNHYIATEIKYVSRTTGVPYGSDLTLAEGKGACRDVAVLFIDCCRALGIPARFVSGYSENSRDGERHDLHAWAEVCLPSGGWRGYDPSSGLVVADRHVIVARSYLPLGTAPVTGTIRSNDSVSHLSTEISVTSV